MAWVYGLSLATKNFELWSSTSVIVVHARIETLKLAFSVPHARTVFQLVTGVCDSAEVLSVAQAALRRVCAAPDFGAAWAIRSRPSVCRFRPRIASDM